MDWPAGVSTPWETLDEDIYNPIVSKEFEAGYMQTRPRFTRAKKQFTLRWESMPTAEVDILREFYEIDAAGGEIFTWQHPVSGSYYAVRFKEDELVATRLSVLWWQVEVVLEEA